jgi:hypothetical protein
MPTAPVPQKARPVLLASTALFALLLLVAWSGNGTSAAHPASSASAYSPLASPTATPITLPYCWQLVPAPDPGPNWTDVSIWAVSASSPDNVWALVRLGVGYYTSARWNGVQWSLVPFPELPYYTGLSDLVAISENDVWAVGSYFGIDTVTMHWNGSQWARVPSPNGPWWLNSLEEVDASAPNDVWAVGYSQSDKPPTSSDGILLHWDGATWAYLNAPEPLMQHIYNALDVVSPNSVFVGGGELIYWNGSSWVQAAPSGPGFFDAVSALSLTDVWASESYNTPDPDEHYFIHSDGTTWTGIGNENTYVSEIDPVSHNDIWAVTGSDLLLHWDGSAWGREPIPGVTINSLTVASSNDIWAVGSANGKMLILHHNPACVPTPGPTATVTPTPPPPPCPGERFTDVCPSDPFYPYIQALAADYILLGYNTTPPCPGALWIPCFRPNNSSTRGQIAKVVSLAADFTEPPTGQTFEDVPPGSTFYDHIQRMAARGIISGYPCGGPSTPCIPPDNRPYFRPNNNVSRGQLSKMIANAFHWTEPATGRIFEDVPPGSTYYDYIGRLYNRNVINGYPCGTPSRPCVPPLNRPYFQPNYEVTRGQTAKIVQLARTQPTPTPTSTTTSLPILTPTASPTCCTNVTASISGSCQGNEYWQSYTITNSCPITMTFNGTYTFAVSPNQNGPWETRIVGHCDTCTLPPGVTQQTESAGWSGPLPPGDNWWRVTLAYYEVNGCWSLSVASTPQPACVLPTATPTSTTLTLR